VVIYAFRAFLIWSCDQMPCIGCSCGGAGSGRMTVLCMKDIYFMETGP